MKTKIVLFILMSVVFLIHSTTFGQERNYKKKSITSLNTVVYYQQVTNEVDEIIKNRLNSRIEAPRFYVDEISSQSVTDFRNSLSPKVMTAKEVAEKLESTVIPEITSILTKAAELRAQENLNEEDKLSALVEQFNSSGVTGETIMKMMNSGYIYLPVVTSYSEKLSNSSLSVDISGYILWYRLLYNDDMTFDKIILVSDTSNVSSGSGTATTSESYELKTRKVDGSLYAKLLAVDTWAKNLAVAMKDIADFSLSGEVLSVSGSTIETNIGVKEDVALDDGYFLIDNIINDEGEEVKEIQGFFRTAHVGNNELDENATSKFVQYYGNRPQRGMLLSEHPRFGIDLKIRPLFSQVDLKFTDWNGFFTEDVKDAYGVNLQLQKNLAKLLNVSQLFANVDVGIAMINAETPSWTDVTAPLLLTVNLGLSKKIWVNRINLEIGAAVGYNYMFFSDSDNEIKYSTEVFGAQLDLGLNYMINADLSAGVYVGYKYTPEITKITATDNDGNSSTLTHWSDYKSNFSGISFGVGISYSLPGLSVDPFAAFDEKIDY